MEWVSTMRSRVYRGVRRPGRALFGPVERGLTSFRVRVPRFLAGLVALVLVAANLAFVVAGVASTSAAADTAPVDPSTSFRLAVREVVELEHPVLFGFEVGVVAHLEGLDGLK